MTAIALVLLTALYVIAVGSATVWDVAAGAAVALAARRLFRRLPHSARRVRPRRPLVFALGVLRLAVVVVWAFGTGAAAVLRAAIAGGHRPGLVEVPFEERSKPEVELSGFLATLAPDEFLVDVDWSRRVMVFHVIDAADAESIRRRHDRVYRKYVAPLFS